MLGNTLWRKATRDLWLHKGRTLLVIAAIAVGVIATGTILTAYSVVTREIDRNFADTNPPSVILRAEEGSYITETVLAEASVQPGVNSVERRRTVAARLLGYNGEGATDEGLTAEWITALLIVVDDFDDLTVATFYPDDGAWDPGSAEILIERSSLDEVPVAIGDELQLQVPGSDPAGLTVTGLTHDPGRLPAWLAGQVVGYISLDGAVTLGLEPVFDELLISAPEGQTRQQNAELADVLVTEFGRTGNVLTAEVPIPGEHPAAAVMTTMLFLLQAFGVLSLLTGGALVATMITAQLKQQSRELGAMKALGGSTAQIASIYFGSVMMLTLVALLVGIPLGLLLGRGFISFTFGLLNFEVESYALSWWVIPAQILTATLIPLLAIALPVRNASRLSVQALMSDHGTAQPQVASLILRFTNRLSTATSFGLRNVMRARSRTLLTIGALSLGGASFMVALNTGVAWDRAVEDEFAARSYDLEVQLDGPYQAGELERLLGTSPSVEAAEVWSQYAATLELPSGGQGSSFGLLVPPVDTQMIDYPMAEGRWLQPSDHNALVVSQTLTDPVPNVGSTVSMTVDGLRSDWEVVGVVRQVSGGSAGVAYSSAATPSGNHLRVVLSDGGMAEFEQELAEADVQVVRIATSEEGRESLDDHLVIIVGLLGLMATLVAIVAGLGLIEAMSISVLERRREIGVMRAVGAPTSTVLRVVVVEGITIAVLSWVVALVLSVPASAVVQNVAGQMFLQAPLSLSFSPIGMAAWLALVVVLAVISSAIPALEATEVPVHQALAHQ